jgi:hypothetical protein
MSDQPPSKEKCVLEIVKEGDRWALNIVRDDMLAWTLAYSPHPFEVRYASEPQPAASKERTAAELENCADCLISGMAVAAVAAELRLIAEHMRTAPTPAASNDIVDRLRAAHTDVISRLAHVLAEDERETVYGDAADEIARLQRELEQHYQENGVVAKSQFEAVCAERDRLQRENEQLRLTIKGKTFVTPEGPQAAASQERDTFEKWLHDVHGLESEWQEHRNCYRDFQAHLAFCAWREARTAPEPRSELPPKLDATMPTAWHYLLVAAHHVVEAVDFNHANKAEPLKWTVPWAKVTTLRDAVLKAKMLNGDPGPIPPPDEQIDHAIRRIEERELSMDDSEGIVEMLKELKAHRASQPPSDSRWIPIAERVPTHIYSVLGWVTNADDPEIYDEPHADIVVWNAKRRKWQCGSYAEDDVDVTVTHWMDLPVDPRASQTKESAP